MPSQIAATPVIKGAMAVEVYKEANQKRSEASRKGTLKLVEKFSTKIRKR